MGFGSSGVGLTSTVFEARGRVPTDAYELNSILLPLMPVAGPAGLRRIVAFGGWSFGIGLLECVSAVRSRLSAIHAGLST